ncbi:MAG: hypothetical protein OXH07_09510 [Chloroflexi bacterium]|nr:hypothetical protein [Chloroflexota bacterium]
MTTILTLVASIVAAVAAVVVTTITVWNTTTMAGWRLRRFAKRQDRHRQEQKEQWIQGMGTNPVLRELESRFDELVAAQEAREASPSLRKLWAAAFDLTSRTPVEQPLGFGSLVILNRDNALMVRSGGTSLLYWRHLDFHRRAVVMTSTLRAADRPATIIK